MDDLTRYLQPLKLGAWQYLPVVGSTNDIALAWAREGVPDWSLVVADAQTSGRGRDGRVWVTQSDCALALSLVVRPSISERACIPRFTALAALGLIEALSVWGLKGEVKWPNDILLAGEKVAGVLVEADWQSDQVDAVVIGMGVNVSAQSVPPLDALRYPATAVESAFGATVDKWALLAATLQAMRDFRTILAEDAFVDAWNAQLAIRGKWVWFRSVFGGTQYMKVVGIQADGQLVLEKQDGDRVNVLAGEILMTPDEH